MSARLENGQYLLGMLYTLISPELMLLDWNFGQLNIEITLLTFIAIFTNTFVYTAISMDHLRNRLNFDLDKNSIAA